MAAIYPSEAARLREEWGDKQCEHPNLEKEQIPFHPQAAQGNWSGDYVCTTCGETFDKDEADAIRQRAKIGGEPKA